MKSSFHVVNNDSAYTDIDVYISDDSGPEWCIRVYKEHETDNLVTVFNYSDDAVEPFDNEAKTVPVNIAGELVRLMPDILKKFAEVREKAIVAG